LEAQILKDSMGK
jgi:hypothetical protein